MVMHARKYPRLNDGYYDRNQAHSFEEKYPSKSHSSSGDSYCDRYADRSSKESPSYSRMRDDSPGRPSPRYQNKSSYKERTKERLDKGSVNSPGDGRLNHHHQHHHQHHQVNSRMDGERHSASSSSSSSTTSKPAYKSLESLKSSEPRDAKTEQIQKGALRVSGDWSEHRSSSGKKYYYNCKSEVSQWEKPKDWIELAANLGRPTDSSSSRSKDRNGRDARSALSSASSTRSSDERYRHSSGGTGGSGVSASSASGNHRGYPASTYSTAGGSGYPSPATASSDHRHSHPTHGEHRDRADLRKSWSGPAGAGGSSTASGDRYGEYSRDARDSGLQQRIPVVCRSTSLPDGPGHGSAGGGGGSSSGGGHQRHDRGSARSRDDRHVDNHHHHKLSAAAFNGARHSGDMPRNDNEDSRQTEDMDISPGSTPTSSRPNSNLGTPIASVNNTSSSMTSSLAGANLSSMGTDLTQQAIQTLQKLQQALMAQQQQYQQQQQSNSASTQVNQSPHPAPDATPPHQPNVASPHLNHSTSRSSGSVGQPVAVDEDSRGAGRDSPKSDRSVRSSRRGSPTPSVASSQSISLNASSLGAAASKKQDSVQLTPSLSNYYNDALIEHCANLQADQAERQAHHYGEEAHSVGTLHCTQVSVDLKRARSLVRIAEIQATFQEQRVLFLRQQTRDLENMRSQNSFMPSQHDT